MRKTLIALILAITIGLGVALSGASTPLASADEHITIRIICQFERDDGTVITLPLLDAIPGVNTSQIGEAIQVCHALPGGTLLPPEILMLP